MPKISEGFALWTNVTLDMSETDGGNTLFETDASENGAGIYSPCNVTAYSNAWHGEQPVSGKVSDRLHVLITHEVVHCYQNTIWGSVGIAQSIPDWITEGTALWLAASDTGLTETMVPAQWRNGYFKYPGRALTNRTYDAYGYFALLDHLGRDLWSQLVPAWKAAAAAATAQGLNSSNAFIASLNGDANDVREAWAPSFLRETSWSDPWIAYGFGLPDDAQALRQPIGAYPAPGYLGQIESRANVVDEVEESAGEIVLVQTDGIANARDGAAHVDLAFQSARFCVKGDCICPEKTQRAGERVADEDMELPFALAINSPMGGAQYRVVGRTLEEECGPKDDDPFPPPSAQGGTATSPCGTGCAGSNGDPHLRTVNNVYYDFQAGGEFTLLRSADSSLEIQVREEPYQSSDHVAINTAVVARDNGHKVGVYFTGNGLVAHVDGAAVNATVPIDLGNGAQIAQHERGFEIDFPDGTQLWALSVHEWGINAQIRPSEALRSTGVGLLGPVLPGRSGCPQAGRRNSAPAPHG